MTPLRIFISYASADAAFATQLMTDLRKAGAEVITDSIGLEETAFEQLLSQHLPPCQDLIVVQTPAALQSPRVRAMVDSALKQVQQGQMTAVVRVIAPALNGAKGQAVPLRWAGTPEFDASQDYPRALARLCLHLGIGPNEVPHAPPPAAASMPPLGLPDSKGTKSKPLFAAPFHAQRSAAKDRPLRPHGSPRWPLPRWLTILLAIVLVVIVAVKLFGGKSSVSYPNIQGSYSGSFSGISQINSSGNPSQMTLDITQQNQQDFGANCTLSGINFPIEKGTVDTRNHIHFFVNFDSQGNATSHTLEFTGDPTGSGWKGSFSEDSGNQGSWNVSQASK